MTPILIWYQLNFGAGNFRGRRPGTSALRMLLRLAAVSPAHLLQAFSVHVSRDWTRQRRPPSHHKESGHKAADALSKS